MSEAGEIITFQIGGYANFVGAHFFNLQDPVIHPEYEATFNTRALWMEGRNSQRQKIVTPRVLMFDLKDNWTDSFLEKSSGLQVPVGGSSSQNVLDQIEDEVSWDGRVQRVTLAGTDSEPISNVSRMEQPNVDKKVKFGQFEYSHWGEYTKWRLQDTSKFAFRIPNFMYNAESDSLVSYGQGLDVYQRLEENVTNGIRLHAEDCDYLQGFQMLVDEYDGFAGISGGILEHLGDEYDKKACLGLGLNRPHPEQPDKAQMTSLKEYRTRINNTVHIWSAFSQYSRAFSSLGICEDMFCINPVAKKIPGIVQDLAIPSISSAILAAALESLTAPYRLYSPSFPLHEMTSLLNAFGHKMALFGFSLPFPLNQRTLFKTLNEDGFSSLTSLTPNIDIDLNKSVGNLFVMRGFKPDQVLGKSESREYKHANINTVTSCAELYCQESYPRSVNVIKDIPTPFTLSYPFPNLYERAYLNSHCTETRVNISAGDSWLLPTMSSAHNTPLVGNILERIISVTGGGVGGSMAKMKGFYEASSETCNSASMELEDYAECVNNLCSLKDTYAKD